jgi:hypothetical protein
LAFIHELEDKLNKLPVIGPDGLPTLNNGQFVLEDAENPWGSLLRHVYNVVAENALCSGSPWMWCNRVKELILEFDNVTVAVFRNSSLSDDASFFINDYLFPEQKKQTNRRLFSEPRPYTPSNVSDDLARGIYLCWEFHHGEFFHQSRYGYESSLSEFAIFGSSLLIANFVERPAYITDTITIQRYKEQFDAMVKQQELFKQAFLNGEREEQPAPTKVNQRLTAN